MRVASRWVVLELGLLGLGGAVGWSVGCSGATSDLLVLDGGAGGVDGSPALPGDGAASGAECVACLTSATCGSGVCAQFQGDTFCASICRVGEGLGSCPSGTTCTIESAFNGAQASVCVPNGNACGAPISPGSGDSGAAGSGTGSGSGSGSGPSPPACVPSSANCDGYAAPTTAASCKGCSSSSSTCQANGCYGGWYCNVSTDTCHAPPTGCTGGTTCPEDAGNTGTGTGSGSGSGTFPPITGTVGSSGGTVSALLFAIVGDTRPANVDDTAGYPTTIIDTIFKDVAARSPQPSFVVSTGDYQFATAPPPSGMTSTSAPQLALYMSARANFPGPQFPAMGNHECNGYTASNCGSGNTDGVTENYTNFITTMLGPIGQTKPYYSIDIAAPGNAWTSKLVFIAANAWDSAQSSWLETTLAAPTTYTFVIRHEATEANTAPGVTPSDTIIAKYPLTLEICGHTHDYSKSGNKIVMGNGGAPLTGSGDYGYGIVAQRSDGVIVVDEYDSMTNAAVSSFHFAVTPTGTLTE